MTENNVSSKTQDHQDIVTYQPVILKVLSDKKALKLLDDPSYYALISFLRPGPMTVEDIEKAYQETENPKSDKTIYRYLKNLEKVGIVVPGGQRVIMGQTATQKLFMRTAFIFERKDMEWMSEKGDEWAQRFGLLASYMLSNNSLNPSTKCIQEFFKRWDDAKTIALEKMGKEPPEAISKLIIADDWRELQEFLDLVYIFGTLMNQPDLLDQLRRCFE